MSNFLNAALKNLGLKSGTRSRTRSRSDSQSSFKDVDLQFRLDDSDEGSFAQWKDAMKMVARLPGGIPPEFRKQLWLALANRYMERKKIDFNKVVNTCLTGMDDPDESELGAQILKDLHRTGCSVLSGDVAEQNQSHLKHVLLAYARWNINVGYCQGFNMLAAIILEVVDWVEKDAVKVMIFLIEGVLPESYFANHLRGLSVDMAVFRDLLRMRLSSLSRHLDKLQASSRDSSTGCSYEPPLTNVFTMQWFLTLFSNCLPKETVLKVWDLILLEGNEVLLRTALAIWEGLADRIMAVESADEFYSIMGVLTREILEFGLMDSNTLLKTICTLAPFPFPQLHELRDNYTYNIQPFSSSWSSSRQFHIFSGEVDDDENDEDLLAATWCMNNELHLSKRKGNAITASTGFTAIGPGAFGSSESGTNFTLSVSNFNTERMTLDISALKRQYVKLKERQKQAHVILTGAFQSQFRHRTHNSLAVNHLLLGKQPLTRRKSLQSHLKFAEKTFSNQKLGCSRSLPMSSSVKESSVSEQPVTSSTLCRAPSPTSQSKNDSELFSADTASTVSDSDSSEASKSTTDTTHSSILSEVHLNHKPSKDLFNVNDADYVPEKLYCDFLDKTSVCASSSPSVPVPLNPFPTSRRIGSMKKKSRGKSTSP